MWFAPIWCVGHRWLLGLPPCRGAVSRDVHGGRMAMPFRP